MNVTREKLHSLIKTKIERAGLRPEDADVVADILVFADERGYHSHGAVRVEYYAERIAKGGINADANMSFAKTGPASGMFEGENGNGFVACKDAMTEAIEMARESGVAVVGIRQVSHSGAIAYYTEMAAKEGMIGISMCQSDPMVVPYGGAEPFFGTNPLSCAARDAKGRIFLLDMATTVQAWGKILDKRSKNEPIPDTWAVDESGQPTTDPWSVSALLPIAEAKGYGLMFMIDILSGILVGVPSGKNVSSMYADLSKGRDLGQLHIVLNPEMFAGREYVEETLARTIDELKASRKAPGVDEIYYPGERSVLREARTKTEGIDIADEVYDYLVSDAIHHDRYDGKNLFAE